MGGEPADHKAIQLKYDRIVEKINRYNYEYYVIDSPSISDYEYDQALLSITVLEVIYNRS